MTDHIEWTARIEEFREGRAAEVAGQREIAAGFAVNKRDKLYADLQEAYILGLELKGDTAAFRIMLDHYGISVRKKQNPWMAITNMLFGKRKLDEQTGEFHLSTDRSAQKYAPCFRLFEDEGWDSETIAYRILVFKNKHGSRLAGIEKTSRARGSAEFMDEDGLIEAGRMTFVQFVCSETKSIADIKNLAVSQDALCKGEGYVRLWAYVDGYQTGTIRIMGLMDSQYVNLDQHLRKVAAELFRWLDARCVTHRKGHTKIKRVPKMITHEQRKLAEDVISKQVWAARLNPGSDESNEAIKYLASIGLFPQLLVSETRAPTVPGGAAKPKPAAKRKTVKVPQGATIGAVENEPVNA